MFNSDERLLCDNGTSRPSTENHHHQARFRPRVFVKDRIRVSVGVKIRLTTALWLELMIAFMRCQDTSDPRHFGTKAQMSWDTSALRKILRHCATLDGKVDECLRNLVN